MKKPAPDVRIYWSKRENALMYYSTGPTGGMMSYHFESVPTLNAPSFIKDLEDRGYDIKTLRFSIRKKKK